MNHKLTSSFKNGNIRLSTHLEIKKSSQEKMFEEHVSESGTDLIIAFSLIDKELYPSLKLS